MWNRRMKKIIQLLLLCMTINLLWCENVNILKIAEFPNNPDNNETISMRSYVDDDDISGNIMLISPDGKILIHCRDKDEVFYFDSDNKKLHPLFDTTFLPAATFGTFTQISNNHYFFFGHRGNFYLVDKDFNLTASISILYNWDIRTYFNAAFYDEDTDTLFFLDEDKGIHSITHPSLDENKNQRNYLESSETMTNLRLGKYAPHLTLDEKKRLCVDGIRLRYLWYSDYKVYETKDYIVSLIQEDSYINVFDRTESEYLYYTIPEDEKLESFTYHPNGDWYFLTMNWTTDTHTLWQIENTWDPEWREQWNKEHSNFDN